jgi:hypothetical protein
VLKTIFPSLLFRTKRKKSEGRRLAEERCKPIDRMQQNTGSKILPFP